MSLHRGQGMDILWRDTLRCPSEDEYVDMVKASWLTLFLKEPKFWLVPFSRDRWSSEDCRQAHDGMFYYEYEHVSLQESIHILAFITVCLSDYVPLTDLIGVYFQIRDDYMNLQSNQVSLLPRS